MSERFASEVSQPLETLGAVVQKTLQVLRSDVLEATWSSIAGDGSVEGVPGADLRTATAKGLASELETALSGMREKIGAIGAQVAASSSGDSSSPMDVSERPGATSRATGATPSASSRMHPFFNQPAAKRTRTDSDSAAATTAACDSAAATTPAHRTESPEGQAQDDAEGASASAELGGEVGMEEGDSE